MCITEVTLSEDSNCILNDINLDRLTRLQL